MIPASTRNATSSWEGLIVQFIDMSSSLSRSCGLLVDRPDRGHRSVVARLKNGGRGLECLLLCRHLSLQIQILHGVAQQSALVDPGVAGDCAANHSTNS